MNPLEQLKDIHIPDDVSMWPLAWPWWILCISILVCVFLSVSVKRKNRWRKLALEHLAQINSQDQNHCIRQCNRLLKQVALARFGQTCASLSGQQWLEFLDEKVKVAIFLPNLCEFANAPDMSQSSIDASTLKLATERWIRKHKC